MGSQTDERTETETATTAGGMDGARGGESDREGEHQGRGHEGEREQVAGRRAYGPHPYLLTSAKSITCLGV